MRDNKHVFKKSLGLFCAFIFSILGGSYLHAQTVIKGQVIDESTSDPLIGATIMVRETGDGESTDFDGKFELKTSADFPLTLVINFMGYGEETLELQAYSDPLRIELSEGAWFWKHLMSRASAYQ